MVELIEHYTSAALAGDRLTAASIANGLMCGDVSAASVIAELLAPSQIDVGQRWLDRACGVGHEHAATFVTESVLSSLTVGLEPSTWRGTIVMVCAEGEWHSLPARMAAELLILQGWRVVFLGPATPAHHLRMYLADLDADAVAVSCSMASNLPGAARTVRIARHLGFTVVVGGAAFGTSARRARAIGADGWATTIDDDFDLDAVIWQRVPEPHPDGDWARIEHERLELTRQAMLWLSSNHPAVIADAGSWLEHVIEDLDEILRHAAAAVLCNDPGILHAHRQWLGSALRGSGLPDGAARVGFDAVAAALEPVAPAAAQMVADQARR